MKNFAWIMIGIVAALAGVLLLLPEPARESPPTARTEAVWKNGRPVDTARPAADIAEPASAQGEGPIDLLAAPDRWMAAADDYMDGQSSAALAWETTGAAHVTGRVAAGHMFPYAGAMWFASTTPMQSVDHANYRRLQVEVQGDVVDYSVVFFSGESQSTQPAQVPLQAGREVTIELDSVTGLDLQRLRAIGIFASGKPREVEFSIRKARLE